MSRPPVPFTAAGIARGLARGSALSPGVLAYGVVFGVLASEAGSHRFSQVALGSTDGRDTT